MSCHVRVKKSLIKRRRTIVICVPDLTCTVPLKWDGTAEKWRDTVKMCAPPHFQITSGGDNLDRQLLLHSANFTKPNFVVVSYKIFWVSVLRPHLLRPSEPFSSATGPPVFCRRNSLLRQRRYSPVQGVVFDPFIRPPMSNLVAEQSLVSEAFVLLVLPPGTFYNRIFTEQQH